MIWHRIKNLATGEEQNVTDAHVYTTGGEWEIVAELNEAPTHLHDFDPKSKKLVRSAHKEAQHKRHVEAEKVSTADLIDMIYELRERVAVLEGAKKK